MAAGRVRGGSTGMPVGPPRTRCVLEYAVLVAAVVGWFLLSSLVVHNDFRTAARETVGAGLGVALLLSIVGAVRDSVQGRNRDE